MEKLMPLGSVLKLKNSLSLIMITGYYAVDEEKNIVKPYIGINYPLGLSRKIQYILFDENSVEKIFHYGYEDEKVKKYNDRLKKLMEEKGIISIWEK